MASHDNGNNRLYVIPAVQPHGGSIRRTLSMGDATYVMMPTQRFQVVSPPYSPRVLMQSPQQRFAPYVANRRGRCNSDGAQTLLMVPTVLPSSPAVSTFCQPRVPVKMFAQRVPRPSPPSPRFPSSSNTVRPLARRIVINRGGSILCPNCGVQSSNLQRCESCNKELINKKEPTRDRLNATIPGNEGNSGKCISSSSFYNGRGESDFNRYVRATSTTTTTATTKKPMRKRPILTRTTKQPENVCITISSDSEDEEEATPPVPASPSSPATVKENEIQNGEMPCKKLKMDSTATNDLESPACPSGSSSPVLKPTVKSDVKLTNMTLNMKVDSVRLGQMKLQPMSVLRISHENMSMSAHCVHSACDAILVIKWQDVGKCELCAETTEPCLYLEINQGSLPHLREQYGMQKGNFPYYDPAGEDDERFFIFYINHAFFTSSNLCNVENLVRKIVMIRKKLKKPSTFFRVISFAESEQRQSVAAAKMETDPQAQNQGTVATTNHTARATPSPSNNEVPASENSFQHRVETRNQSKQLSDDLKLMFSGPRVELFVYPTPPIKGGISVTNEDQFCLNEGEFLNDVIIEFYLKYVYNKIISDEDRKRSHMFSCFFYERLMQKTNKKVKDVSPAERRHSQVKKWTRNVDIFSKDFIFVPINEASHWYLAVICFAAMEGEIVEITKPCGTKVTRQVMVSPLPKSMRYLSEYGDGAEGSAVQGSESKGQMEKNEDPEISEKNSDAEIEKCKGKNITEDKNETSEKVEDQGRTDKTEEKFDLQSAATKQISSTENPKTERTVCSQNLDMKITASKEISEGQIQCHPTSISSPGCEKRKLISINLSSITIRKKLQHHQVVLGAQGHQDVTKVKLTPESNCSESNNDENLSDADTVSSERNPPSDSTITPTKVTVDKSKVIEPTNDPSMSGVKVKNDTPYSEQNIPSVCSTTPDKLQFKVTEPTNDSLKVKADLSSTESIRGTGEDPKSSIPVKVNCKDSNPTSTTKVKVNKLAESDLENLNTVPSKQKSQLLSNRNNDKPEQVPNPKSILCGELNSVPDNCPYTCDNQQKLSEENRTGIGTSECREDASEKTSNALVPDQSQGDNSLHNGEKTINIIERESDILDIYVTPGIPAFTLPRELEQKCKISPNKNLKVNIPRIPNESPVKVKITQVLNNTGSIDGSPIRISLSSLSSVGDSVIVVSSSDSSDAEKSLNNGEPTFDPSQGSSEKFSKEIALKRPGHISRLSDNIPRSSDTNALVDDSINEQSLHLHFETSSHDLSDELFTSDLEPLTSQPKQSEQESMIVGVRPLPHDLSITECAPMEIEPCSLTCGDATNDTITPLDGAKESTTTTVTTVDDNLQTVKPNSELNTITNDESKTPTDSQSQLVRMTSEIKTAPSSGGTDSVNSEGTVTLPFLSEECINGYSSNTENALSIEIPQNSNVASCKQTSISHKDKNVSNLEEIGRTEIKNVTSKSACTITKTKTTTVSITTPEIDCKAENSTCEIGGEESELVQNADPCPQNVAELPSGGKNSSTVEELSPCRQQDTADIKTFKRPCILIFDSLRGPSRSKIAVSLREYLTMEWKTRKLATHGEKVFDKDTLKMCSAVVPQQDNYTDCGLFLLHYVEKFFSSPVRNFSLPLKELEKWFDPKECSEKRMNIKKVIDELHEDWIARKTRR